MTDGTSIKSLEFILCSLSLGINLFQTWFHRCQKHFHLFKEDNTFPLSPLEVISVAYGTRTLRIVFRLMHMEIAIYKIFIQIGLQDELFSLIFDAENKIKPALLPPIED